MALVARIEENIQLVLLPLPYPQIQREPKREKEREFFPNAVCVYFCNKSKQKKWFPKKQQRNSLAFGCCRQHCRTKCFTRISIRFIKYQVTSVYIRSKPIYIYIFMYLLSIDRYSLNGDFLAD